MDLNASIVFAGGEYRKYEDARVGLLTHGLNYGTGCFEGIRGYWNASEHELYVAQPREHFERLHRSVRTLLMTLPYGVEDLVEMTLEVCARNRFEENVYIRPLVYKSAEDVGVRLAGVDDAFALIVVPFSKYYDSDAGLKTGVSSWRRIDDTMAPARAKITGTYINSALAKSEALLNGFDEAIMLSYDGHVSEGSAANLLLVRDGVVHTPDPTQNVLEGITRRTVIELARTDLGLNVVERAIDRSELYTADELFLTGTAAGITFINSVDHRTIGTGSMGPVTRELTALLAKVVAGAHPTYRKSIVPVYANRRVGAA